MPAIRIDWQAIRSEIEGNGQSVESPFLFVLPHAGRHLLMSIIDTLKYKATYRIEDYDYNDWDNLIALVEKTHYGLMEGEQVGDISDAIVYLADKLSENFNTGESEGMNIINNVCCCGGGGGGSSAQLPLPVGVDEDYDPTHPPYEDFEEEPDSPWNNEQEDVCAFSNYLLLSWRNLNLGIANGEIGGSNIAGRIDAIFPYGVWTWVTGKTDAILRFLEGVGVMGDANILSQEIDSNYKDLQCAVLSQGGQKKIIDAIYLIINSMALGFWTKTRLKMTAGLFPWATLGYSNITASASSFVPQSYYARGCPDCSGGGGGVDVGQPPTVDETLYEWVKVPVAELGHFEFVQEGDVNIGLFDNRVTITAQPAGDGRKYSPTLLKAIDTDVLGLLVVCNYPLENIWNTSPTAWPNNLVVPANPAHYMYFNKSVDVDFGSLSHTKKIWNSGSNGYMGQHTFYNSGSGSTSMEDYYYLKPAV